MLIVLLGVTGQLERNRWVARLAAIAGTVMMGLCWGTSWVVPGVHRLSSGLLYVDAGPLTALNLSQLAIWLVLGLVVARRATTGREARRMTRLLLVVLALGAVGSTDLLLVYDVGGSYPLAWVPGLIASAVALYLVLRTDLLRPQGLDRGVVIELAAFVVATGGFMVIAFVMADATAVAQAAAGSAVWAATTAVAWSLARRRPPSIAGDRELEQLVAELAEPEDAAQVGTLLTALWRDTIGVTIRTVWLGGSETLHAIGNDERWELDRGVPAWLVENAEPLAAGDLATMRLGPMRPKLEAMVAAHDATLIVPLIDRGHLVGLVEAEHARALREDERGLVIESARAAGRALSYVALARAAALEGETAREVEVAQAMRLSASASRDDELGRWVVAAEYRPAPATTGAGWSVSLLADGRLAVLVTEAQAHGLAAALATAALTGAFAAATSGGAIGVDELVASLRASAEGVVRGGEPVAAFVAVLDHERGRVEWASAGHPGGQIIGPIGELAAGSVREAPLRQLELGGGGERLGASLAMATRGTVELPPDTLLVVASTGLRGADDARWQRSLRELARTGPRLASALVEAALRRGVPDEDLLAVVVRLRARIE